MLQEFIDTCNISLYSTACITFAALIGFMMLERVFKIRHCDSCRKEIGTVEEDQQRIRDIRAKENK